MILYLKRFWVCLSLVLAILAVALPVSAANLVRVSASEATLYSGSAETSGVEGVAHAGDEFYLRSDGTANGFYKIEYQGHPAYISASQVELVAVPPTSTPIPPTPVPPSPTPLPPTPEPPTPVPPTPMPPTPEPTTPIPPSPVPATPVPPTPVPPSPTTVPTAVPPTSVPTFLPTPLPMTQVPTAVPTRTRVPTPVPVLKPASRGTKVLFAKPKGSLVQSNSFSLAPGGRGDPPARSAPYYGAHLSSPYVFQDPVERKPREPGEPSIGMVRLGFGWGAGGPIRPAFHPLDESADRNVESADLYGVGVEFRSWLKFMRFFFDWSGHSMATLAAKGNQRAAAEYLGDGTQVVFPSDLEYRVTNQALRLGLKLGLPMGRFEPWIGGAVGTYFWHADYEDTGHTLTYGEDNGMALGANAMLGVDYFLLLGTSFDLIVTPFLDWGAPAIYPKIQDLAGFGADWKDEAGTPVMAPWRFGVSMGIGF